VGGDRALWAFAKREGLQQGKTIRCNQAMQALFGTSELGFNDVVSPA
jgi:hypothetical protein